MDTPTFAWRLFELFSPAALSGLTWHLAIGQGRAAVAAKVKSEHFTRVLLLVDDIVLAAAREVQQVLVDKLKAASAAKGPDGNLTPEQDAQAKQAALDSAKIQLGTQGLADVAATFGLEPDAAERILGTRIEAAVHQLKTSMLVAPGPGTAETRSRSPRERQHATSPRSTHHRPRCLARQRLKHSRVLAKEPWRPSAGTFRRDCMWVLQAGDCQRVLPREDEPGEIRPHV